MINRVLYYGVVENMRDKILKKAFTLAEILITLGIIGIVSAMTIPTLVGKYRKQRTVTQLKKIYSITQQAIEFSKAEYGDIKNWEWDLTAVGFFKQYMGKSFKTYEVCENKTGCWSDKTYLLSGEPYSGHSNRVSFKVADGTLMFIEKQDDKHMHIWIDLNGLKKPNTFGKDVFVLTLTKESFNDTIHNITKAGIYMFGHGLNRNTIKNSGCNKTSTGFTCGELILMDNWKIKEDYPW